MRQTETEQAEVETREANVRGDKFDECYSFWFIYKTCLTGNQNPLKLHQWSRLKNTK